MRNTLCLLAFITFPLFLNAQKKKELVYRLSSTMVTKEFEDIIDKYCCISVSDKNEFGDREITCSLEAIFRKGTDFKNRQIDFSDTLIGKAFWHFPFHFVIDKNGVVSDMTNREETIAKLAGMGLDAAYINGVLLSNILIAQSDMQQLCVALPAKKEAGYTWMKDNITFSIGKADKQASIVDGKDSTGNLKVKLEYDNSGDFPVKADYQFSSDGFAADYHKSSIPADTLFEAIDTAYYTTLVRMTTRSDYFKSKREIDSAKVNSFLRINDPKYLNYSEYRTLRRSLLRSNIRDYQSYREALRESPTAEIKSNFADLFNKLQFTVEENTDVAEELIHAFSANPIKYDEWIDTQFFQAFAIRKDTAAFAERIRQNISDPERAKSILKDAMKQADSSLLVLEKLMKSSDSAAVKSIKPMYLWVKSFQTKDKKALLNIAKQFDALNAASYVQGKTGKYKLLFYEQLNKNGMQKDADSLLDKVIAEFQENQSDTAFYNALPGWKGRKAANKLLLAHSYFLKYKRLNGSNKEKALEFLAQSAAASPVIPEEFSYESNYDTELLSVAKSYAPLFAEELVKSGKPDLAVKLMARQLQFNPSLLDSLEHEFNRMFPGKSFTEYFKQVVGRQWTQAPDFTLKGLNGEIFRLSDYRGKWILLDFWGSWCSPCRAELPHLNQLAAEIKTGKHPDNVFLAISCRESEDITRSFVKDMDYTFPNAIADNKIEGNYKISGYPTKILVSPTGTMLPLAYGSDYANILKSFSTAYFKKESEPTTKLNNQKKD